MPVVNITFRSVNGPKDHEIVPNEYLYLKFYKMNVAQLLSFGVHINKTNSFKKIV